MGKGKDERGEILTQMRMGVLGAATAVLICFCAAAAFAGQPAADFAAEQQSLDR